MEEEIETIETINAEYLISDYRQAVELENRGNPMTPKYSVEELKTEILSRLSKNNIEEFKKMLIQEIEKVTFDIEIGEHLRDGLLDFEEVQEIIKNIN